MFGEGEGHWVFDEICNLRYACLVVALFFGIGGLKGNKG